MGCISAAVLISLNEQRLVGFRQDIFQLPFIHRGIFLCSQLVAQTQQSLACGHRARCIDSTASLSVRLMHSLSDGVKITGVSTAEKDR